MFQSTGQKICRVVIAGNSLSKDTQDKDTEKVVRIFIVGLGVVIRTAENLR